MKMSSQAASALQLQLHLQPSSRIRNNNLWKGNTHGKVNLHKNIIRPDEDEDKKNDVPSGWKCLKHLHRSEWNEISQLFTLQQNKMSEWNLRHANLFINWPFAVNVHHHQHFPTEKAINLRQCGENGQKMNSWIWFDSIRGLSKWSV